MRRDRVASQARGAECEEGETWTGVRVVALAGLRREGEGGVESKFLGLGVWLSW